MEALTKTELDHPGKGNLVARVGKYGLYLVHVTFRALSRLTLPSVRARNWFFLLLRVGVRYRKHIMCADPHL